MKARFWKNTGMNRGSLRLWPLGLALLCLCDAGCSEKMGALKEHISEARARKEKEKKLKLLADKIPQVDEPEFTSKKAEKLVLLSLDCVDRQYPNKPGHVLENDMDLATPKTLHPSFFGCFDWHSAVHGHWAMVKILKTFPANDQAFHIREKLNRHLGRESVASEAKYFERDASATFERPYGYGWFLRLCAEIHDFEDPDAQMWSKNLKVLEEIVVQRVFEYFFKLSVPVREGTHHNSAFALSHAYDYAESVENDKLLVFLEKRGRDYYEKDRSCPLDYEPSGEDFISPCLAEADFMRRILPGDEFASWFDDFMPLGNLPQWEAAVALPEVLDKKDPKIGHLIGLAFHRAWTMRGIAGALDKKDVRRNLLLRSAQWHESQGLSLMSGSGYGGEHWLASFAVFSLTNAGLPEP